MSRASWVVVFAGLVGCASATDDVDRDTDDAGPPALGPDVEGVAFREVGLTLTVASVNGEADAALDVNDDGVDDFDLELSRSTVGDDTFRYGQLSATAVGNELLVGDVPNAGADGGMVEATRALALGERVEGSATRWSSSGVLHELESFEEEVEDDYGIAGEGRVLLGVRFLAGVSDLLNGWIEVSVDGELTTVTVHRSGWAELPEVGVGAGDR